MKHLSFLLFLVMLSSQLFSIEIKSVSCELSHNPENILIDTHRFGWELSSKKSGDLQTAYQIIVSTSLQCYSDMWDSGKVLSDKSQFVSYSGKKLEAGKKYYYKVRVWDRDGKSSSWSSVCSWRQAPELKAQWIGAISHKDSRLPVGRKSYLPKMNNPIVIADWGDVDSLAKRSIILRKELSLPKKVKDAVVYICGLGHYVLTVNGVKIGDSEFAPLWSDYDKTLLYNTYDVTDKLKHGENVFGVMLGNGMYNVSGERYRKFWGTFGPPTLYFQSVITYTDGSHEVITSDKSWKWSDSPITFNCIFGGEDYDARLEQDGWDNGGFDATTWSDVVIQDAPKGVLMAQLAAPVKIMERYAVKSVRTLNDSTLLFDMGQNLAGFPTLKVKGTRGDIVRMVVAESIKEGNVNQGRSGSPYYFEYTLKGGGVEVFQPCFSYYGYQYIRVEGADYLKSKGGDMPVITELTSNFIHNSVERVGSFECSNEIFTKTHWLINNAIKSNMQAVFTDCPHREKLGWLEEIHLNGPGIFYNYGIEQLIPKVMRDMADAQHPDGLIPSIAPEYTLFLEENGEPNAFSDSPEWGSSFIIVPFMYYEYYGDDSLIKQYYPRMKQYLDYLMSKSNNFILSHGLGDWYDYGVHKAGKARNSSIDISASSHLYLDAALMLKAAKLMGNSADEKNYTILVENIKQAFNKKFFNKKTAQYDTGSQFSNAMPIFLDIVEPEFRDAVMTNLLADIKAHGNRLTTGDVGNRYLFQTLARNGYNDVMFDMHNHYETPGYGFQLKFGLSTLTEQWDPRNGDSWNHFMMGQIEEWFFTSLLGIKPDPETPGFKNIVFEPTPVGDMTYAKGSHKTLYGIINASWTRDGDQFLYMIKIPVNCTGKIVLPKGSYDIIIDGKPAEITDELIGSGLHKIECKL